MPSFNRAPPGSLHAVPAAGSIRWTTREGVTVAVVSAHADSCAVLLGPTAELLDLDDLEFGAALKIVRVVLVAQLEAQGR